MLIHPRFILGWKQFQFIDICNILFFLKEDVIPLLDTPTKTPPQSSKQQATPIPESPLFPQYQTPVKSFQAPSDTESEMDEPVVSLDSFSKEELFQKFRKMERSLAKYKSKFSEVSTCSFTSVLYPWNGKMSVNASILYKN